MSTGDCTGIGGQRICPSYGDSDLHHGAALLLGTGLHPRVAQQSVRHASSKTTTEIDSHVTTAQERQAAEVLQVAPVG